MLAGHPSWLTLRFVVMIAARGDLLTVHVALLVAACSDCCSPADWNVAPRNGTRRVDNEWAGRIWRTVLPWCGPRSLLNVPIAAECFVIDVRIVARF
jgi:hypothetical protein